MPVQTGGEAVIDTLIANNVDTVFGLPGAQLDPIFAALHDRQDKIKIYHSRHEQGCAYMAYGYAASTNKTGVCFIVPGPGLLNAGAAMVTAYACNSPVLYFSGQLRANMIDKGWGALHEIKDQFGLAGHLVKWSDRITHASEAPGRLNAALSEIRRGRQRPVYLESPFDILKEQGAVTKPEIAETSHSNPELDPDQIDAIAKQLATASNPMIIAGGGAMDAGPEILALAEKINAPIVLTQNGLGAIDSRNERVFSQAGGYGLWKEADVVIAFGTRLFPAAMTYGHKGLSIIKVDIDPTELSRLPVPLTGVVADSADAASQLSSAVEAHAPSAPPDRSGWTDGARAQLETDLKKIEPQRELLNVIREEITEDGIFVSDLTQLYFASQDAYPVYSPRSYIQPSYQGTLGHAVGTALGVKIGNPDRPVICVAGDGGFMFTVQELATAAKYNIGVIFLVMNDSAFGNVKRILQENYGGREICADLHNPDFVKLADSFGIDARKVNSPATLRQALRHGVDSKGPMLIEYEAPEFPSPWHLLHRKPVR
ncbi:MAG: thiamine pyrophosphate-binding protein [Henriciella sp.]